MRIFGLVSGMGAAQSVLISQLASFSVFQTVIQSNHMKPRFPKAFCPLLVLCVEFSFALRANAKD